MKSRDPHSATWRRTFTEAAPSRPRCLVLALSLAAGTAVHATGLTINTTFDATVTGRGDAAQWISAWNYAVGEFTSRYSDPITINLTFQAGGGLGGSGTALQFIGGANNYAAMKTALLADSKSANDATAYANLPSTDPTGGRSFVASFANAKALGLRAANDPANDGTITIGTGNTYTFDPNNRAVAGAYDFIGVAEHEISEVMGRIGILGQTLGTGRQLNDPLDLFGYSAVSTLNLNQNQAGVYFSIDGGVTHLKIYNDHTNGGDDKDWASGQGDDSFNAFGATGAKQDLTAVDLASLDVIGYDSVSAPVPEASAFLPLAFGVLGLLVANRNKLRRALRGEAASDQGKSG